MRAKVLLFCSQGAGVLEAFKGVLKVFNSANKHS